jgi:hypothetical protein
MMDLGMSKDEEYSSDSSITPERLYPRVEKEDVKHIGIELKYKLRYMKISLKELEKVDNNSFLSINLSISFRANFGKDSPNRKNQASICLNCIVA